VKRKDLYYNFTNDPECRVFLSTDAGGVGLNLQAAAYLINLDIPWNPAVLEQRIARIYRYGQKKNVSITNLVARNTIEERMLDVLKFKGSLAQGILDNGENNIFMGESKFKKFMQSVEEITTSMPKQEAQPEQAFEETKVTEGKTSAVPSPEQISIFKDDDMADEPKQAPQISVSSISGQEDLIKTGLSFLNQLVYTLSDKNETENLIKKLTEKDTSTGKTYLKIPIENETVIQNAMNLMSGFIRAIRR